MVVIGVLCRTKSDRPAGSGRDVPVPEDAGAALRALESSTVRPRAVPGELSFLSLGGLSPQMMSRVYYTPKCLSTDTKRAYLLNLRRRQAP